MAKIVVLGAGLVGGVMAKDYPKSMKSLQLIFQKEI